MNIFYPETAFRVGEVEYGPGGSLGLRIQPNLQLVWVWEGYADIEIDGESIHIGKGECILLFPSRRERFTFARSVATRHGWCEALGASVYPDAMERIRPAERRVYPTPESTRELSHAALALVAEASPEALYAYRSAAQAILLSFAARAHLPFSGPTAERPAPLPAVLARALARIRNRSEASLELESLAEELGVSRGHLGRLFRLHLGTTPAAYLWDYRTERAHELLLSTGLRVSEIAERTGFSGLEHLSRRIRERYGRSPRELRSEAWGTSN